MNNGGVSWSTDDIKIRNIVISALHRNTEEIRRFIAFYFICIQLLVPDGLDKLIPVQK